MFQFFKTTALGGILFLIPVIILIVILAKAHELVSKLAAPALTIVPVESVFGIAVVNLVTLAVGVLICFLAGLAAKTPVAGRFVAALESKFLSKVPAYDVEKTKLAAQLRFEEAEKSQPVLVRFDDQWQIGFEIDNIAGGEVAVYLPGAPDPWSGTVSIVTDDRISRLDSTRTATLRIFKNLGKGAGDLLQTHLEKGR